MIAGPNTLLLHGDADFAGQRNKKINRDDGPATAGGHLQFEPGREVLFGKTALGDQMAGQFLAVALIVCVVNAPTG